MRNKTFIFYHYPLDLGWQGVVRYVIPEETLLLSLVLCNAHLCSMKMLG